MAAPSAADTQPLRRVSRAPSAGLWLLAALLILLLAAALRLHLLGAQSLWNDEGSSYIQATRPLAEIAANAARDIHPPGYYWLLHGWRLLAGDSEFALRMPSALAGILTVALTFALGRRLFGVTAGVVAAGIVAANGFSIYYSQEARMYALLGLWAAASMWALLGLLNARTPAGERGWGLALAACNAAGLWTQYVYPAVMLVQGLLVLVWLIGALFRRAPPLPPAPESVATPPPPDPDAPYRPPWQQDTQPMPALSLTELRQQRPRGLWRRLALYVVVNLMSLLLYLPWVPTAYAQLTSWPSTGQPIPTGQALTVILGWFSVGISYTQAQLTVAFLFFALFGLLSVPDHGVRGSVRRMLLPVLWVVVPVGGFLALGLFREANLKFLLPAQIGFALWVGRGAWVMWTLTPRRTRAPFRYAPRAAALIGAAALGLSLFSGLDALYSDPAYQRDDYRGIVAAIGPDNWQDAAVVLNAPGQIEVFSYYFEGPQQALHPLPIGLSVDREATLAAVDALITGHSRVYAVLWGTDERDPEGLVEGALDAGAFEVDSRWYGSVRLVRYVTPVAFDALPVDVGARFGESLTLERYALSGTQARAEDVLLLRLDWSTAAALDRDYKVFVQLIAADGTLAAQRDAVPVGGQRPTSGWVVGETITDPHALYLPPDIAPGAYTLIVGLYDAADPTARLLLSGGGDYLVLAQVTLLSP